MNRVYTRRLSGPQAVHSPTGTVIHLEVPSGHVYIVKQLLIVATGSSELDCRLSLRNTAMVAASVFSVVVPAHSAVGRDVLLPLEGGELLWVYSPVPYPEGLITMSGYDFLA